MNPEAPPLSHPVEDALVNYALGEADGAVERHCSECPACARYVKEIRDVQQKLRSLEEYDIPERIGAAILTGTGRKNQNIPTVISFVSLYRHPVVIGIMALLLILLLYWFVAFVL